MSAALRNGFVIMLALVGEVGGRARRPMSYLLAGVQETGRGGSLSSGSSIRARDPRYVVGSVEKADEGEPCDCGCGCDCDCGRWQPPTTGQKDQFSLCGQLGGDMAGTW